MQPNHGFKEVSIRQFLRFFSLGANSDCFLERRPHFRLILLLDPFENRSEVALFQRLLRCHDHGAIQRVAMGPGGTGKEQAHTPTEVVAIRVSRMSLALTFISSPLSRFSEPCLISQVTRTALGWQTSRQAPHLMHLAVSMVWTSFFSPRMASVVQTCTQAWQPSQSAGSIE